jgi:hypothetical protein
MKLKCKACNHTITNDLQFTKHDYDKLTSYNANEADPEDEDIFVVYRRKRGFISIDKCRYRAKHKMPIVYIMSNKDVDQDLIDEEHSSGCCSYVDADIVCKCGVILGIAENDCWTDEVARINKRLVYV